MSIMLAAAGLGHRERPLGRQRSATRAAATRLSRGQDMRVPDPVGLPGRGRWPRSNSRTGGQSTRSCTTAGVGHAATSPAELQEEKQWQASCWARPSRSSLRMSVEQVELRGARQAVQAAGAVTELLSIKPGRDPGRESRRSPVGHLHRGQAGRRGVCGRLRRPHPAGRSGQIPMISPQDEAAVGFVRETLFDRGKPVGVICHGPWTLVETGVVQDRTLTCLAECQDGHPQRRRQCRRPGGGHRPEHHLQPLSGHLPAFCARIVEQLAAG